MDRSSASSAVATSRSSSRVWFGVPRDSARCLRSSSVATGVLSSSFSSGIPDLASVPSPPSEATARRRRTDACDRRYGCVVSSSDSPGEERDPGVACGATRGSSAEPTSGSSSSVSPSDSLPFAVTHASGLSGSYTTKNASPLLPSRMVKSISTPFTVTVTTFSRPRISPWYLPNLT